MLREQFALLSNPLCGSTQRGLSREFGEHNQDEDQCQFVAFPLWSSWINERLQGMIERVHRRYVKGLRVLSGDGQCCIVHAEFSLREHLVCLFYMENSAFSLGWENWKALTPEIRSLTDLLSQPMLSISGLLNLLTWVEHRQQVQASLHEKGGALCPVPLPTLFPPAQFQTDHWSVDESAASQKVRIEWIGGSCTEGVVIRPIGTLTDLSTYSQICQRVQELTEAGWTASAIAQALCDEGYRSRSTSCSGIPPV